MTQIEELEARAAQIETNREEAIAAMVALSVIYGDQANLLEALDWAEKAAFQDSSDGYLEITRIVGSACIATEDYKDKMQYASYVIGTCDTATLRRFGRADIAYNVGTVCEYMAQYHEERDMKNDSHSFDMLAGEYYLAATDMDMSNEEVKSALLRVTKRHASPVEPQKDSWRKVYASDYVMR